MKEKIKYGIYAFLYMVIWLCALVWTDTAAQLFFEKPCLDYLALLGTCVFTVWVGVHGMVFNIGKIQLLRALKWLSDKEGLEENAGKRED